MLGDGKRIKLFSRGSGVVRERDGGKSSEVEIQDWKGNGVAMFIVAYGQGF